MKQLNLKKLLKYAVFVFKKEEGHIPLQAFIANNSNLKSWQILPFVTEYRFAQRSLIFQDCPDGNRHNVEEIFTDYYSRKKYPSVIDYIEDVVKKEFPEVYKDLYK